jgi:hypothetical protein
MTDELPDFSIPPGMKLPGPGEPIGDWLDTHATPISPELKKLRRLEQNAVEEYCRQHNSHIEAFCAAYLKMTDIPPTEAVLVEERTATGFRWYFERRKSDDKL